MRFLFIFIFLSLTIFSVSAQGNDDANDQTWQVLINNQNAFLPVIDKRYSEVKGSPYLNNEWTSGMLLIRDSTVFEDVRLKYDIFNDYVLFTNRKVNSAVVLDTSISRAFQLVDSLGKERTFYFESFSGNVDGKDSVSGYFEMLYDDQTKVYSKLSKSFIEADNTGAYSAGRKNDEFQNNPPKYFVKKEDGTWFRLNKSRSSFEKAFIDKEDEISSFIRKNKLKLKDVDDILKVVEYYDSF